LKKLRILLVSIVGIFVLAGCNRTSSDPDLQILGVNTKNIDRIEIIHGNIILYPDFDQKDNLTLIEDFSTALDNTGDKIETLDENLGIDLVDAEAYAQNDAENYFVYITFSNQQTLSLKNNSKEEQQNCDGVLFDINNMKLHWSKDNKFVGTMGYSKNSQSIEKAYSTFLNDIKNIFIDLGNGV
jgi:hypothetical protein